MLRRLGELAVETLYPTRCVDCGVFGNVLCDASAATLTPAAGPGRCGFCRAAWDGDANCPRCYRMQAVSGVLAAVEMKGAARRVVHALKYEGVRDAAEVMGRVVGQMCAERRFDAVFAVPLHRSRQRERGFNQAELIARAAGWAPERGLRRIRRTAHQVGMHERIRRQNVAGAFAYAGSPLTGAAVAVIDDVITTGATVQECASVLRDAGAREVWAVAFARTSYGVEGQLAIED